MELKNDITLEDFVEQVADDMFLNMDAKDKDYIRSHKLDVFQQHFVLGLYARNNYIYPFFNRPDVLYTSLRALQPDENTREASTHAGCGRCDGFYGRFTRTNCQMISTKTGE